MCSPVKKETAHDFLLMQSYIRKRQMSITIIRTNGKRVGLSTIYQVLTPLSENITSLSDFQTTDSLSYFLNYFTGTIPVAEGVHCFVNVSNNQLTEIPDKTRTNPVYMLRLIQATASQMDLNEIIIGYCWFQLLHSIYFLFYQV